MNSATLSEDSKNNNKTHEKNRSEPLKFKSHSLRIETSFTDYSSNHNNQNTMEKQQQQHTQQQQHQQQSQQQQQQQQLLKLNSLNESKNPTIDMPLLQPPLSPSEDASTPPSVEEQTQQSPVKFVALKKPKTARNYDNIDKNNPKKQHKRAKSMEVNMIR